MTISLKHEFESAIPDGDDDTLVRPSNWNAEHVLLMATGFMLGRVSASDGVTEELSPAQIRTLINVEDGAAADLTAAEILALLLVVDGTGSALDADLLDGNHASAFQPISANLTAWAAEDPGDYSTTAEADVFYQPLDADLTAIAALTTEGFGLSLLELVDAAALEALISALTFTNTGLHIRDTGGDHDYIIAPGEDASADRTLTLNLNNANRTLSLPSPTFVNTILSGYLEAAEISTPSNPAANSLRVYPVDDGGVTKLATLDSAGTETILGEGGASAVAVLASGVATSGTAVNINGFFTSEYSHYELRFSQARPSGDARLAFQVLIGGSPDTDSDYRYGGTMGDSSGAGGTWGAGADSEGGAAFMQLSLSDTESSVAHGCSGVIDIYNPLNTTSHKDFTFRTKNRRNDGFLEFGAGGGCYEGATTALSGVRFIWDGGESFQNIEWTLVAYPN
jgi:hypothetical protein